MKNLLIFLIVGVFLIGLASSFEFDNIISEKEIAKGDSFTLDNKVIPYNDLWATYKPIEIKNAFGLGETLFKGAIIEHTKSCSNDCESIIDVSYTNDAYIQDIRFIGDNPREYQIYISNSQREVSVNDYEQQCTINNGFTSCTNVKVGKHNEIQDIWVKYNLGEKQTINKIKIEGIKNPTDEVDWQVMIEGQWLESWATWGSGNSLQANLMSYYKLDDNVNDSLNYSGAIANNGEVYIAGKINNGSDLEEGLNQYLTLDDGGSKFLITTQNISISGWINLESLDNTADKGIVSTCIAGSNGFGFYIKDATGALSFGKCGVDEVVSTQTLSLGQFYFVVVTYDQTANEVRFYINGSLDSGGADSYSTTFSAITSLWAGGQSATDPLDGILDEIAIWNRTLTADEITTLYNSGTGLSYAFNEGVVTLNSPANLQGFATNLITLNSSATVSGTTLKNVTLFDNRTGTWAMRNSTTKTGTSNTTTFVNYYSNGRYIWNMQWCAVDNTCGNATSNYTFTVDSTAPTINLNYPTSLINYGAVNGTLQLNLTATDSNLASVWYNYNGTNITIAGAVSGTANLSNITLSTKKNITIYANDTSGNLNTTTFSWDYYVFEITNSYISPIAEGTSSSFSANLTMTPTYRLSSAVLHYDSETTAGTAVEYSTNNWYISTTRVAPSVTNDTNYTFYWTLTFENSVSINTTSLTQQVNNIAIDNCGTYTNKLFNLTLVDEDTQIKVTNTTNLTTTIKVDFLFKNPTTGTTVINYSAWYNNTNPALICSGSSISGSTFSVDAQIQYYTTERFTEFYHLQNYTLNTTTANQNITLYDLNSTGGGLEFKINYKNSNFRSVPGAVIQIKRKYVDEGIFKVVELPLIGADGYAIAHIIPTSDVYSLVVISNGTILNSFDNIVAYCPNPTFTECTITLNSYGSAITPGSFDNQGDFSSSLTYNKTSRVITAIFTIPSGATATVNLNATKSDAIGTTLICNDTLTASGGTLTCTIPASIGNTSTKVYLTANGILKKYFVMTLSNSPTITFGSNLIILGIIMILFFIGIGVQQDPKIMGILLILGVIIMSALNLITSGSWIGTGATILWFIVAVVIILIKSENNR